MGRKRPPASATILGSRSTEPLPLQARLLRALAPGRHRPSADEREARAQCRLVSSTL